MIKLAQKCLFIFVVLFFNPVHAGLITTDLTEDNYIVIGDLQWAWASPVNVELWGSNTLYAPDLHDGWGYASDVQLGLLKDAISTDLIDGSFDLFTRNNGSGDFYVHAFQFWNDFFSNVIEIDDVAAELVRSIWAENDPSAPDNTSLAYMLMEQQDTFYVRSISQGGGGSVDVPEPTTVMIFGFGLIALALRKKFL